MATIRGRIIKRTGNQMPGIGMGVAQAANAAAASGAQVVVFKGGAVKAADFKTLDDAKASPDFVTVVDTDSEGRYEVTGLEAGTKYTVVANIDGKLYLNLYDSLNNWASIEAKEGENTFDIEDTSGAFF